MKRVSFFRQRTARLVLSTFLGIACFVCGCEKAEKEATPVVSVKVEPAQRGAISQVVSAEAIVFPLQQAVIAPKITSTIREFRVQRGSRVHKGQLLAVLENADLSAAELQSKGEFEQAEAAYATTTEASLPQQIQKARLDAAAAKAAYEAQQKVYDSRKDLYQQGALPRRDLDAAEVALAQARSQYEVAKRKLEDLQRIGEKELLKSAGGQLSAAKGKYEGARAQLSYSEIRSPIDGVVTDRPLFPGDLASANQPLLTVMDTSKLIAKAHLAEADAAALKVRDPAEMRVPGVAEPVKARVSLVSPALDPGSTTIEVWFEALRPNSALRPGMTVQVSATARTVKDAILIPGSALFKNPEGGEYVLLAGSDGRAHAKEVRSGISNGGFTQILEGVKSGDPVISEGGYGVPDNTQIKITPAAPSSDSSGEAGGAPSKPDRQPAKEKE